MGVTLKLGTDATATRPLYGLRPKKYLLTKTPIEPKHLTEIPPKFHCLIRRIPTIQLQISYNLYRVHIVNTYYVNVTINMCESDTKTRYRFDRVAVDAAANASRSTREANAAGVTSWPTTRPTRRVRGVVAFIFGAVYCIERGKSLKLVIEY